MAAVVGRPIPCKAATLADYRCVQLRGRRYPGLLPCPGAQTVGLLYALPQRRDLGRIDRYEGSEYVRRRLPVHTARGPVLAWVYLPRGGRRRLSERPWSATGFERRYQRHYLRRIPGWRRDRIAAGGTHAA
jgi:hypothetical protein